MLLFVVAIMTTVLCVIGDIAGFLMLSISIFQVIFDNGGNYVVALSGFIMTVAFTLILIGLHKYIKYIND